VRSEAASAGDESGEVCASTDQSACWHGVKPCLYSTRARMCVRQKWRVGCARPGRLWLAVCTYTPFFCNSAHSAASWMNDFKPNLPELVRLTTPVLCRISTPCQNPTPPRVHAQWRHYTSRRISTPFRLLALL